MVRMINPLENLKKNLGEMLKSSEKDITFHQGTKTKEDSFLIKISEKEGYVFRVNKEGVLNIIHPESVNTSSKTHEKIVRKAKKYFESVKISQYERDIFKLKHIYQS